MYQQNVSLRHGRILERTSGLVAAKSVAAASRPSHVLCICGVINQNDTLFLLVMMSEALGGTPIQYAMVVACDEI